MHELPQIAQKPNTVPSFMAPKSAGNIKGAVLIDLRESRRLTQKDVYEVVGVSEAAYRRWEKGGAIMRDHLRRLAKFFGVEPGDLVQQVAVKRRPQRLPQLDRIEAKIDEILETLSSRGEAPEAQRPPQAPPARPPQVASGARRSRRRKAS